MDIASVSSKATTTSSSLSGSWQAASWAALAFAILQSACTAVVTISGARVLIGLGSLAAVAAENRPATGFHQDSIRYPMLAVAALGSLVNLYVLWRVRSLRARPAAQWRQKPLTQGKRWSERLQIWLSVLTLALVVIELWTHPMLHHPQT